MSKKRKKIGVDIDGVLVDTNVQAYFEYCEKELGWDINYDLFAKTHSWHDATGQASTDTISNAFKQFIQEVEESQQPIEGAHDALKSIQEVADIFLITARVGQLKEVTEEFLRTHLADVHYHELSMGNVEQKARRIIDFELDYFIDDSFREISTIVEDKTFDTVLIPFPAFHGQPQWDTIQDNRIHWLSVWDEIVHDLDDQKQAALRKKAWEEIAGIVV